MKIREMMFMGLRNLFRRKARTSLTVVGMAIGIVLIMVLASISIGVRETIDRFILENGSMTIIWIYKRSYAVDDNGQYQMREQKITDELVSEIKKIKNVKAATPILQKQVDFFSGKYQNSFSVQAMDCNVFEAFGFPELEVGSYPTPENNKGIVFGSSVVNWEYYQYSGWSYKSKVIDYAREKVTYKVMDWQYQPTGKKKQKETPLTNYAIMKESTNYEHNYNVYMDLEYFKELYTEYANTLKVEDRQKALKSLNDYEQMQINVNSMRNVTAVEEKIQEMGYQTNSNMQYIQPMIDTADMLQNVLIGIGLVAMLVAAINIANTMIMSIYERTREIGIMKVLGCLVTDVKKLFLFESAVLGLLGGLIGIGLSYLSSFLINKYGSEFLGSLIMSGYAQGNKPSVIPIWLPFLTALFAIFIGVASGYLPANRATKISAIEAMKAEN